jgi:hypothetical protein
MFRTLRNSGGTSSKCLPAGQCSRDYRRRDGRLEPLRWFLITEIPSVCALAVSTLVSVLSYNGQSHVIAADTAVATHFSWDSGCGDQFGPLETTAAYHTVVTYAPIMTMTICLVLGGLVRQFAAKAACCERCCLRQAGTRNEERVKVARGWCTCLCLLCGGLNFLLAPVLSFGWSSNYVCINNATCASRMASLAASGDAGTVCCGDYDSTIRGSSCNVASFRILFLCTSFALAFAICLAFYSAISEKSRRQSGGALMPARAPVYGENIEDEEDSDEYDVEDETSDGEFIVEKL